MNKVHRLLFVNCVDNEFIFKIKQLQFTIALSEINIKNNHHKFLYYKFGNYKCPLSFISEDFKKYNVNIKYLYHIINYLIKKTKINLFMIENDKKNNELFSIIETKNKKIKFKSFVLINDKILTKQLQKFDGE